MTESNTDIIKKLTGIFEKTFADKSFSRGEKQAVAQLLEQDYKLDKEQRDLLRSKIFDIARQEVDRRGKAVVDWLETAAKLLINRGDTKVYFSPVSRCRQRIIDLLDNALSAVDICVFTISDDPIAAALLGCKKRGVKVRIITDDEKINDYGSDIKKLAAAGIPVRMDNSVHHMHHKFALFDKRRVLTGSYNWTRSVAEENQENILVTDDKQAVIAFRDEFERLWANMEPFVD